jgi:hypothetical protein
MVLGILLASTTGYLLSNVLLRGGTEEHTCPICLDSIPDDDTTITLKCNPEHKFDKECLYQFITTPITYDNTAYNPHDEEHMEGELSSEEQCRLREQAREHFRRCLKREQGDFSTDEPDSEPGSSKRHKGGVAGVIGGHKPLTNPRCPNCKVFLTKDDLEHLRPYVSDTNIEELDDIIRELSCPRHLPEDSQEDEFLNFLGDHNENELRRLLTVVNDEVPMFTIDDEGTKVSPFHMIAMYADEDTWPIMKPLLEDLINNIHNKDNLDVVNIDPGETYSHPLLDIIDNEINRRCAANIANTHWAGNIDVLKFFCDKLPIDYDEIVNEYGNVLHNIALIVNDESAEFVKYILDKLEANYLKDSFLVQKNNENYTPYELFIRVSSDKNIPNLHEIWKQHNYINDLNLTS